jgi:transposase
MRTLAELDNLPRDPDVLLDVIRRYCTTTTELQEKIDKLKEENHWLREIVAARNRRLFGRKSEKLNHEELQAWLFNEAELGVAAPSQSKKESSDTITYTVTRCRKQGRKPIAANLPRIVCEHDLPETEKVCGYCGKERPRLKPDISEEVEYIPAQVNVKRHVYHKYAQCKCAESKKNGIKPIISAPREKRIIPGCIAAPSLLAFLATSKFCDGLPYYRLEKMLGRYGIEYKRATMCNQMIGVSRALQPLLELMWEDMLAGEVIRMDETRLQVIEEPGRNADQISWMHVAVGEYERKRIILFHYHRSRAAAVPKTILEGWKGYLQTDGLAAYNRVGDQPGIIHVGCWGHTRRKFIDARGGPKAPPGGLADEALSMIRKIFAIERKLRAQELSDDEFLKTRRELVEPVLKELKNWLNEHISGVAPKTYLAEAMNYTLNEWDHLIRYLDHPWLHPDNNIPENAIRPFVIGRKNWMFSITPIGAHASATLYSFVESAKANGLEPYKYFTYLIKVLPTTPQEQLRNLLPHRIDPKLISGQKD